MSPHHLDWCGDRDCGDPSHRPAGFAEQGFADGYDQGWNDAKQGRPYGTTPARDNQPTREDENDA